MDEDSMSSSQILPPRKRQEKHQDTLQHQKDEVTMAVPAKAMDESEDQDTSDQEYAEGDPGATIDQRDLSARVLDIFQLQEREEVVKSKFSREIIVALAYQVQLFLAGCCKVFYYRETCTSLASTSASGAIFQNEV